MAAKIADHEATEQIFGTMSERVVEIVDLIFEFLLDPAKQFLIDDWRIKSWNLNWLPRASALALVVV